MCDMLPKTETIYTDEKTYKLSGINEVADALRRDFNSPPVQIEGNEIVFYSYCECGENKRKGV